MNSAPCPCGKVPCRVRRGDRVTVTGLDGVHHVVRPRSIDGRLMVEVELRDVWRLKWTVAPERPVPFRSDCGPRDDYGRAFEIVGMTLVILVSLALCAVLVLAIGRAL